MFRDRWAPALAGILLMGLAAPAPAADVDGAAVYKRCAACHLADRSGVPGAFPPLKADIQAFARKPEGRGYLVAVVTRGLSGEIRAEGKTYRGMMPAQAGLNDAQVAAVLNHISGNGGGKPFTDAEVAGLRAKAAKMTPTDISAINRKLAGK